jgi:hypothetical protein
LSYVKISQKALAAAGMSEAEDFLPLDQEARSRRDRGATGSSLAYARNARLSRLAAGPMLCARK